MKRNSYDIDNYLRAKEELKILETRSHARLENLLPQLREVGLKKNMNFLEVGSGTGTRSIAVAKYLTQGRVVGIDISESLLDHANKKILASGLKNLSLQKMDLFELNFEPDTFDFVYVRLVLQHLPNPVAALKNLHRVMRPGGFIFLEDTDRDWLTIFPTTKNWEKIYAEIKKAQIHRGGDSQCGRKLASFLNQSGFKEVEMNLVPVFGTGRIFSDWLKNYAPSFFNHFQSRELKEKIKVLEDLKKMHKKKPLYMHQVWFQAWGRK